MRTKAGLGPPSRSSRRRASMACCLAVRRRVPVGTASPSSPLPLPSSSRSLFFLFLPRPLPAPGGLQPQLSLLNTCLLNNLILHLGTPVSTFNPPPTPPLLLPPTSCCTAAATFYPLGCTGRVSFNPSVWDALVHVQNTIIAAASLLGILHCSGHTAVHCMGHMAMPRIGVYIQNRRPASGRPLALADRDTAGEGDPCSEVWQ
jgi:hypothetical protein